VGPEKVSNFLGPSCESTGGLPDLRWVAVRRSIALDGSCLMLTFTFTTKVWIFFRGEKVPIFCRLGKSSKLLSPWKKFGSFVALEKVRIFCRPSKIVLCEASRGPSGAILGSMGTYGGRSSSLSIIRSDPPRATGLRCPRDLSTLSQTIMAGTEAWRCFDDYGIVPRLFIYNWCCLG
jgi:hypothetical protein